jgi:hypothetical protein
MAAASRSGGSLSQPSEPTMTIAPRSAPPWFEAISAWTFEAMRVPPKRSATFAVACSIATAVDLWARTAVSRVSVVANANTSASARRATARIRCR